MQSNKTWGGGSAAQENRYCQTTEGGRRRALRYGTWLERIPLRWRPERNWVKVEDEMDSESSKDGSEDDEGTGSEDGE